MLKRFKTIHGKYIEKIFGQERLAYSMSDGEDFYDMIAWAKRGGYQGSVIRFYDFTNGEVYVPFEKERNVLYGQPVFADGYYYFLQGDYDGGRIVLYRYEPAKTPEPVTALNLQEVELYNLRLVGTEIHIISQGEVFRCYYPKRMEFIIDAEETVVFIEDQKVYTEKWIEEGWDGINDRATENYNYYHKVIVRDVSGSVLSEDVGFLHQSQDGTWWVA